MITDKLGSYAAARRQLMPAIEHRAHNGLNNRAENSHLPFRRREHAMQGFRSPGGLQRFVVIFSAVRNLFVPPHFRRSALATHQHRLKAMAHWKTVAGITARASHTARGTSWRPPEVNVTMPMAFSKLKALLRKRAARTFDTLCHALRDICELFDPTQCQNFFKAAGYEAD